VVDSGYGHDHLKYMTTDGKRKDGFAYRIIKKIALAIYYFAFVAVSYGVYQQAHLMHHAWIVADALNGITGGFFLVYPFNIFRENWVDLASDWIGCVFIMIILTATAEVIGGILGLGGFV
jgi:hypothetical protein